MATAKAYNESDMLTEERNRQLAQVGPAPDGDLLRRYWMPIAGASELAKNPIKAVRLMGEDLVLLPDMSGTYVWSTAIVRTGGPTSPTGSSRNAASGATTTAGFMMPTARRSSSRSRMWPIPRPTTATKSGSRPTRSKRKPLLWAYLGPQPRRSYRTGALLWKNGFAQIVLSEIPCNWFQCQENSIDPSLRVDAPQLVDPAARRDRSLRAPAPQARLR